MLARHEIEKWNQNKFRINFLDPLCIYDLKLKMHETFDSQTRWICRSQKYVCHRRREKISISVLPLFHHSRWLNETRKTAVETKGNPWCFHCAPGNLCTVIMHNMMLCLNALSERRWASATSEKIQKSFWKSARNFVIFDEFYVSWWFSLGLSSFC